MSERQQSDENVISTTQLQGRRGLRLYQICLPLAEFFPNEKRSWCSGNMELFQSFAAGSIPAGRKSFAFFRVVPILAPFGVAPAKKGLASLCLCCRTCSFHRALSPKKAICMHSTIEMRYKGADGSFSAEVASLAFFGRPSTPLLIPSLRSFLAI